MTSPRDETLRTAPSALEALPFPAAAWRSALPRIGLGETSDLSPRRVAALLASAGERVAAAEIYREILDLAPEDVEALELLAAVVARLGRDDEELAVRRRIAGITADRLGIAPEHRAAVIAFDLAAHGLAEAPAATPAAYVIARFDGFAERFDRWLREELHYLGPEQVVARIARTFGAGDGTLDVCDAGCGTGLLGLLLRPYARRLDGIDVSPRMLDKARALGVYDALLEADLVGALARTPAAYDVITAADVLVYFGDLGPVLAVAAAGLRDGGLFVFTVERAEGGDHVLTDAARYAHSAEGVRRAAAAAGLVEVCVEDDEVRREGAYPVRSLTCAFRKAACGR